MSNLLIIIYVVVSLSEHLSMEMKNVFSSSSKINNFVIDDRMGIMFASAPCNRFGKLFCLVSLLTALILMQTYNYSSFTVLLQLDFAATISALIGIPFPYGRCSISIL